MGFEYEQECAAEQCDAGPIPPPTDVNYPLGALVGQQISKGEYEKRSREARCQQAIYALNAAREIRANAALMAEVRNYIRSQRDDLAQLLDEVS